MFIINIFLKKSRKFEPFHFSLKLSPFFAKTLGVKQPWAKNRA